MAQLVEAEGVGHLFRQFPGTVAVRLANDLRVPRKVLRIVEEFNPLGPIKRAIPRLSNLRRGRDPNSRAVATVSRLLNMLGGVGGTASEMLCAQHKKPAQDVQFMHGAQLRIDVHSEFLVPAVPSFLQSWATRDIPHVAHAARVGKLLLPLLHASRVSNRTSEIQIEKG